KNGRDDVSKDRHVIVKSMIALRVPCPSIAKIAFGLFDRNQIPTRNRVWRPSKAMHALINLRRRWTSPGAAILVPGNCRAQDSCTTDRRSAAPVSSLRRSTQHPSDPNCSSAQALYFASRYFVSIGKSGKRHKLVRIIPIVGGVRLDM